MFALVMNLDIILRSKLLVAKRAWDIFNLEVPRFDVPHDIVVAF